MAIEARELDPDEGGCLSIATDGRIELLDDDGDCLDHRTPGMHGRADKARLFGVRRNDLDRAARGG